MLFYKPSLERLGIGVGLRIVDPSQYENRTRDFDFDIVTELWGQSLSPGNEQREFWGSEAADRPGSRNSLGIRDPGDRRADRPGHLRQGPRRARRGDEGARPRAAGPRLRRAAMDLSLHAHGALEPLRPAGDHAEIRRAGLPDDLVVGCGTGREDGVRASERARRPRDRPAAPPLRRRRGHSGARRCRRRAARAAQAFGRGAATACPPSAS